MRTLAEIDAEREDAIRRLREPLLDRLRAASRDRPWRYLLFGSLARGDPVRGKPRRSGRGRIARTA